MRTVYGTVTTLVVLYGAFAANVASERDAMLRIAPHE
jgi:hypothetical protein